jgi:hypothetical protein
MRFLREGQFWLEQVTLRFVLWRNADLHRGATPVPDGEAFEDVMVDISAASA